MEHDLCVQFAALIADVDLQVVECDTQTKSSAQFGDYPFLAYKQYFVPKWQILDFWLQNCTVDESEQNTPVVQSTSSLLYARLPVLMVSLPALTESDVCRTWSS